MKRVNCSIVLYRTPADEVTKVVTMLRQCSEVGEIWLIDNSELMTERFQFMDVQYIHGHGNIGYGRGHNIALQKSLESEVDYHLVLNSDIAFSEGTIEKLIKFMDEHENVGHVMPKVLNPDGSDQFLAKRLPKPWDLIYRRLTLSQRCALSFDGMNDGGNGFDVEYLSGCFMMLRNDTLRKLKEKDGYVFDPRFFLYPEDMDLTRRMHTIGRTVYLPSAEITHYHRKESYKSLKMMCVHSWNMIKYFWKWR
ncbi:MAG: glycosyltransferase family 2 protein [Paludibacteraceae bacterium]|nr:glycosyltransferase family 2 protein [Paludibacteraceae bacterium]